MNAFDALLAYCHNHPMLAISVICIQAAMTFFGFFGSIATQMNLENHEKKRKH